MIEYVQLVFLWLAASLASSLDEDCIYKECICSGTNIDCSDNHLIKVPTLFRSTTAYSTLHLDSNAITDIPAGSLPPNLTALFLTSNPITTVADTAFFDSAYTLVTLTFSSAGFTRIPDAFRSLKVLNGLDMNGANILDWNEEAMINIGQSMESLSLQNVGMKTWPDWLRSFTRLKELTIAGGFIDSVPDGALDNVTNILVSLSMFNNSLRTIPKAFSSFTVLQNLYLQQNKIVDVTWVPQASKLSALSLNYNLISDANHLSTVVCPLGKSLGYLDIKFNRLTAIPNITCLTLGGTLDLTNNRISDPNSGGLSQSVSYIYFSYNFLPAIPRIIQTLQYVPELTMDHNVIKHIIASDIPRSVRMLDLGFNLITEVTDTSFPVNCSMTGLHLNNNPIITISEGAFKNLGQLNTLDIKSTRLTRLPLALGSLDTLFTLDMSDNPNLVCTCQEKSLEHWVMPLTKDNVLGSCGILDIYDFYSELSPSC